MTLKNRGNTERVRERERERETHTHIDRQKDRQIDRQTHTHTHTHTFIPSLLTRSACETFDVFVEIEQEVRLLSLEASERQLSFDPVLHQAYVSICQQTSAYVSTRQHT